MPGPRQPDIGRNLVNQRSGASGANSSKNSLPSKIKCYICKKVKNTNEYASVQLKRYKDTIYNPYAPKGRSVKDPKTTCKTCTPGQTEELTCRICHKTKELDSFAKRQRSNPEKARCTKCVKLHLETEPDITPPSSDYYESDEENFDAPQATTTKSKSQISKIIMPEGYDSDDDDDDDDEECWEDFNNAGKSKGQQNVHKFRTPTTSSHTSSVVGSQITARSSKGQAAVKSSGSAMTANANKPKRGMNAPAEGVPSEWASYSREIRGKRGESSNSKKDDDDSASDDTW